MLIESANPRIGFIVQQQPVREQLREERKKETIDQSSAKKKMNQES
jgi:hypothetical protein